MKKLFKFFVLFLFLSGCQTTRAFWDLGRSTKNLFKAGFSDIKRIAKASKDTVLKIDNWFKENFW